MDEIERTRLLDCKIATSDKKLGNNVFVDC